MILTYVNKIGMMAIVFAIATTFSACQTSEEVHSVTFYDYMYTSITISLYATENEADMVIEVYI